jgi:hypothetical protein
MLAVRVRVLLSRGLLALGGTARRPHVKAPATTQPSGASSQGSAQSKKPGAMRYTWGVALGASACARLCSANAA